MSHSTSSSTETHHVKFRHIALTFVASIIVSAQSSVNAEMNKLTHNPLVTALTVFITGLVVVAAVLLSRKSIRDAFVSVPALVRNGELKWWYLLGGLSGATFVAVQSKLVEVTGVAIFTVAAVAGQTAGALFVDKFGIGPAGKQAITLGRIASALLGVIGVVVSVSGSSTSNSTALGGIIATFAAGLFVSTQPALNGQVAMKSGEPVAATTINFIVGLLLITVVFVATLIVGNSDYVMPPAPWQNPVVWLGGPAGVFFVLTAAKMARTLGVFVFTLTSVLGQLSGAILMDVLFPTSATNLSWQLFLGVAITGSAVVMASLTSKPRAK